MQKTAYTTLPPTHTLLTLNSVPFTINLLAIQRFTIIPLSYFRSVQTLYVDTVTAADCTISSSFQKANNTVSDALGFYLHHLTSLI